MYERDDFSLTLALRVLGTCSVLNICVAFMTHTQTHTHTHTHAHIHTQFNSDYLHLPKPPNGSNLLLIIIDLGVPKVSLNLLLSAEKIKDVLAMG